MALPFEDIVSSPTFTFLIGKDKKPMYLHNALVARQSKTLDTMMNGAMSEATQGFATLDDVEVDTFLQFSKWLYTGDYDLHTTDLAKHVSSPVCIEVKRKGFGGMEVDQDSAWAHHGWQDRPVSIRKQKRQSLYAADASKKQGLWAALSGSDSADMPSKVDAPLNLTQIQDLGDFYLFHAQMYCFADRYGVLALQGLAVDKLKQNLIEHVQMTPDRIEAIVEMIAYTMEHTATADDEEMDKLRCLILDYAAITFELLFDNEVFKSLFVRNEDFSLRLAGRLIVRLD